jgi:phosphatidylglycerol:prolipoprotein diacylglycerol transferase
MHPVLLSFDLLGRPVVIYSYGALLLAALFAGSGLALFLAGRAGIDRGRLALSLAWVAPAALAGARVLSVATNFSAFSAGFPLSVFDLHIGGVVAYGGFLGGFLALWAAARVNRWPVGQVMDLCAPGAAMGIGITRIGCFFSGCCFGCPSRLPWAVSFPAGSPAYLEQLGQGLIPAGAAAALAVHPVQFYESTFGALLCAVLLRLYRRRSGDGQVAAAFFGLYALFRFGVEFLRCDTVRGGYSGLSTSQILALVAAAAVAGWEWRWRARLKVERGR